MKLLEVKNLSYYYKDGDSRRYIFTDTSLCFEKGLFYAILGDSGSGKTTFLSIIGGQDNRYEGEVLYRGKEIRKIGLDKYRRTTVSTIYQNYNLIPHLNALENICIAMDISDNVKKIEKTEITALLEEIGLSGNKITRKCSSLSGGEQQRVAIARSIETNPEIIIADEPTGNLDWKNSEEIIQLFSRLAHDREKCIIMVTHNEKLALKADHIYTINEKEKKMQLHH